MRSDFSLNIHSTQKAVCVFSSHSFWTSSSLDVPAGVTQEEGHTGFLIHLLSAVRALIFLARRIQPFLSLVDREVEFCVQTVIHFTFDVGVSPRLFWDNFLFQVYFLNCCTSAFKLFCYRMGKNSKESQSGVDCADDRESLRIQCCKCYTFELFEEKSECI